jgi:A/G-specific adenine glycosylase
VNALAASSIDDVLFLWEGLGYYTRARNLHKAANYIVDHCGGTFPRSYEELLALPGIGHTLQLLSLPLLMDCLIPSWMEM